MNVLLTKKFSASDIVYINERIHSDIRLIEPGEYSESGVLEKIESADVLFGGLLSEAVVSKSDGIRFAQIPWTGIDSLNFPLLAEFGLTVCNSHSNASVVGEHAIALGFAIAKKLTYHDAQMRKGNWNRVSKDGNEVSPFSTRLTGKRVTFIGYGAIAQSIGDMLSGFSPHISAVTNTGVSKHKDSLISIYKSDDICKAVMDADLVFVCAPLTEKTRKMVDQAVFDAMPDHALLINVARGEIVSESALFHSLANNIIGGAAIDTWYQHPNPALKENYPSGKYEFHKLQNIVMSPHRAGYVDSGFPHLDDAIENLNRAVQGLPLLNIVSTSSAY